MNVNLVLTYNPSESRNTCERKAWQSGFVIFPSPLQREMTNEHIYFKGGQEDPGWQSRSVDRWGGFGLLQEDMIIALRHWGPLRCYGKSWNDDEAEIGTANPYQYNSNPLALYPLFSFRHRNSTSSKKYLFKIKNRKPLLNYENPIKLSLHKT